MLDIEELDILKRNTYATILNATKFMIHHGMDQNGTKFRSTSPTLEKYGIWPTTEFLEFLLTNNFLPITPEIVNLIEGMVGFIIEKYNSKEKKWPLTDVKGSIASAITSGHCIYVLKLYISRPFVNYTIVNDIRNFCFRLLPKPYAEAFARPKAKFLMSFTIKWNRLSKL